MPITEKTMDAPSMMQGLADAAAPKKPAKKAAKKKVAKKKAMKKKKK